VNSAIAATTISDPTIGGLEGGAPQQHGRDAGRKQHRADHAEPALHFRQGAGSRRRNQPVIQAKQEQLHAADQVEVGVCRGQQEVLLHAHHDAGQHPEQQKSPRSCASSTIRSSWPPWLSVGDC
jgi:hypothetical protein